MMHYFSAGTPEVVVGEKKGAQVGGEENSGHGELLTGRVDCTAGAKEVISYSLGGKKDLRSSCNGYLRHRPILLTPLEKPEPGVVGRYGEEGPENREAWRKLIREQ
jgi:hypothetical protein